MQVRTLGILRADGVFVYYAQNISRKHTRLSLEEDIRNCFQKLSLESGLGNRFLNFIL